MAALESTPTLVITLLDMEQAARSGCQLCKLRVAGVLKAMALERKRDVLPEHVTVCFGESVVELCVQGELSRESPAFSFSENSRFFNVQLHTLIGLPQSSSPLVGIGREMSKPREFTY
jgi:hypothetical protein